MAALLKCCCEDESEFEEPNTTIVAVGGALIGYAMIVCDASWLCCASKAAMPWVSWLAADAAQDVGWTEACALRLRSTAAGGSHQTWMVDGEISRR